MWPSPQWPQPSSPLRLPRLPPPLPPPLPSPPWPPFPPLKTVLSSLVRGNIILSGRFIFPLCRNGTTAVFVDTLVDRDWPSRHVSPRYLQKDNLNRLDFSKRKIRSGSSWHDWTALFLLSLIFPQKKKWKARNTWQTWFFQVPVLCKTAPILNALPFFHSKTNPILSWVFSHLNLPFKFYLHWLNNITCMNLFQPPRSLYHSFNLPPLVCPNRNYYPYTLAKYYATWTHVS